MPNVKVGVVQAPSKNDRQGALAAIFSYATTASQRNIKILLFPEAYLGGYPRGTAFGAIVGSRDPRGREQFREYHANAVDLGDDHELRFLKTGTGDGTKVELEKIAAETGVFLAVGLIEKVGGTLYCAVLSVDPAQGVVGKRRKLMPTGAERLCWGFGQPQTLKAVKTNIGGTDVTIGSVICWENYMPLLRYSIYSQNVNLYLAPTADARETWLPSMQHIAIEGRCYVLSTNQFVKASDAPEYLKGDVEKAFGDGVVSRGGAAIVDPFGKVIAGPLWNEEGILEADIDFDDCVRGKMDFDVSGHYQRHDAFKFGVVGLDA